MIFYSLRDANEARQKQWANGDDVSLLFRATELGGEVGELLNVVKKLERERMGWRGSRATKQDLADELADVVICADLMALTEGIDLNAAVVEKFNATSEKVGLPHRLASGDIPAGKGAACAANTPTPDIATIDLSAIRASRLTDNEMLVQRLKGIDPNAPPSGPVVSGGDPNVYSPTPDIAELVRQARDQAKWWSSENHSEGNCWLTNSEMFTRLADALETLSGRMGDG